MGSTHFFYNEYLVVDDETSNTYLSTDDEESWSDDIQKEDISDKLFGEVLSGNIDFDNIMESAVHGRRYHGVYPKHLSKIYKINVDMVERELEVTS